MATVTGKVLKPFSYRGESLEVGEDAKLDVKHAGRYEKLNYVKLDKEAEKKVEAAATKADKGATPTPPKTK